ncbi:MAG: helix-turn-helix domain-containing protein [Bacillota bacterium]
MDNISFGEKVRKLREIKNWSLVDLAEMTGLSKSFLSDIENNKSSPTLKTIEKLAEAFKLPEEYFVSKKQGNILDFFDYFSDDIKSFIEHKECVPYIEAARFAFVLDTPPVFIKKCVEAYISVKSKK